MRLRTYHIIVGFFCAAICFSSCQSNNKVNFSAQTEKSLDSLLTNIYHNFPVPGLAIAVIKGDSVYFKTLGKSNIENNVAFTDSTVFFMGSLSEPMVATGMARLAQLKKLSFEDPIVKHLPYFKLGGEFKDIRISHLLTHTSGIPPHDAVWDMPSETDDALESTTRSIELQEPKFVPPGSRVSRTPYNYDIAADVIAKANLSSFETSMKENVFKPLGMNSSTFMLKDIPKNNLASPYQISDWLNYSMTVAEFYPYNREHAGSIGFHTTIKDAATWMYSLLHSSEFTSFLDKKTAKQLTTPFKKTNLTNLFIGYGWEIEEVDKKITLKKNNQLGNFSGEIYMVPEDETGILVVSNIAGDFNTSIIIGQIENYLRTGQISYSKQPVFMPLGKIYNHTQNIDSVFLAYKNLKEQQPNKYDYSDASFGQFGVNLLYRLNKAPEAVKFFEFCIQQNPASAITWLNLSEAYLLNKDFTKADTSLKKAKTLSKDAPDLSDRLDYIETTINMIKESETKK